MTGPYSREALAQVLGPEAMALAEAESAAAPPPGPLAAERVQQIVESTVERLMLQQQLDMAEAA